MSQEEKKERIDYLWRKVRFSFRNKVLWDAIKRDVQLKKAARFDLSADNSILVDTEDEVEFTHKYPSAHGMLQQHNLSWYIISPGSLLETLQHIIIETLTLFQMFITPLCLVFESVNE